MYELLIAGNDVAEAVSINEIQRVWKIRVSLVSV
jgi:hypothetical protein